MSHFIFSMFESWYLLYQKNEKGTNIIGIGGWRINTSSAIIINVTSDKLNG